jgi:hypothetical protein
LPSALHSDKGPTAILLFEHNKIREVVGIVRVSLDETEYGSLLPMPYRVQNELPGGVIDLEWNDASRPAETIPGDSNTAARQNTERLFSPYALHILF